jgi:CBS domain-containing protein
MTLVREYMSTELVTVGAADPLDDVVRTLLQRNVSCVLVEHGTKPVGVISMTDLMRISKLMPESDRKPLELVPPTMKARDAMKPEIIAVSEDAPVGEAAAKMLDGHIHRVFVRRGEAVVGVFSTRDAMRVVLLRKVETPVAEVMSAPSETIGIGDSIDEAIAKLEETRRRPGGGHVRGLAVLDGKVPVGVFTQLEAIKARSLPANVRSSPVEELMSYEVATLDATTPLYRAAGQAIATNVRRILVTQDRTLAGIVTGYDVARVLIDR